MAPCNQYLLHAHEFLPIFMYLVTRFIEKTRILEKEMYQELLISGLIIPFYFVCEMCEVFRLNQVKSMIVQKRN